jgi:tetratricopeptide (TPR) repeat protein
MSLNESLQSLAHQAKNLDNEQNIIEAIPRIRMLSFYAVATLLACVLTTIYAPSLRGPYVYDDLAHLQANETLDQFPPKLDWLRAETRPVVMLSFAAERWLFGESPMIHRIGNLVIHLAASLVLFELVHRTAGTRLLKGQPRSDFYEFRTTDISLLLAGLATILWSVHPLNTQAVAYIIQRCESLMGLCFLLFLLMLVLHQQTCKKSWLFMGGVLFLIGLWSKTIMVTAILVGPLYDRAFLTESWKKTLSKRGSLYLAPICLSILAILTLLPGLLRGEANVGFGNDAPPAMPHLAAQAEILFRYLSLSLFPIGLNIDHGLTIPQPWTSSIPQILSAIAVLASGIVAGSCGRWRLAFFILAPLFILAPTSSFIPTADLMVEHRMYLPLASILTGCVFGLYLLLQRISNSCQSKSPSEKGSQQWMTTISLRTTIAIGILAAVMLSFGTWDRAHDYQSGTQLWYRSLLQNPANPRAAQNLSNTASNELSSEATLNLYLDVHLHALSQGQETSIIRGRIGEEMLKRGKLVEAIEILQQTIQADPTIETLAQRFYPPSTLEEFASHRVNYALAMMQLGMVTKAEQQLEAAFEINDQSPLARAIAGDLMAQAGAVETARIHFERALELRPEWPEVQQQLENLLINQTSSPKSREAVVPADAT